MAVEQPLNKARPLGSLVMGVAAQAARLLFATTGFGLAKWRTLMFDPEHATVYSCENCGWEGYQEDTAEVNLPDKHCCPLCGAGIDLDQPLE